MRTGFAAIALTLASSSCTSNASRNQKTKEETIAVQRLDSKIAAEPPASSADDIGDRAAEAFSQADGLTTSQKIRLLKIYRQTYEEAVQIQSEIGKSKSLLFSLVSSSKYDSKDIERIKNKVVALDQKRLKIMFKALADVQAVVGYGDDKQDLYKHFFDFEYPKHGNLSKDQQR